MKNLNKIIIKLKKEKKIIGLAHGVFDVIHIGHINYFREAKKKVDFLVSQSCQRTQLHSLLFQTQLY